MGAALYFGMLRFSAAGMRAVKVKCCLWLESDRCV